MPKNGSELSNHTNEFKICLMKYSITPNFFNAWGLLNACNNLTGYLRYKKLDSGSSTLSEHSDKIISNAISDVIIDSQAEAKIRKLIDRQLAREAQNSVEDPRSSTILRATLDQLSTQKNDEYSELYKSIYIFIVQNYQNNKSNIQANCLGNALLDATNTYVKTEIKNSIAKNIYMKAISDAYDSAKIAPNMASSEGYFQSTSSVIFRDYYKFTSIVINKIYEDKIEREFYTWLNRLEKVVNETYTQSHYDAYRTFCVDDIPKEEQNEKYIRTRLNKMKFNAKNYFAQDKNDRDHKLFNKQCVEQLDQISNRYPIGRELSKFHPIIKGFISFLISVFVKLCYFVGVPTYRDSFFRNNISEEAESFKRNVAGGKSNLQEIEDEIHYDSVSSQYVPN